MGWGEGGRTHASLYSPPTPVPTPSRLTVLYRSVPLCTTLHHSAPFRTALYRPVPRCTTLFDCSVPLCTALYRSVPLCTPLYRPVPRCTTLFDYSVPLCTALYRSVPFCTALYRSVPLCIALFDCSVLLCAALSLRDWFRLGSVGTQSLRGERECLAKLVCTSGLQRGGAGYSLRGPRPLRIPRGSGWVVGAKATHSSRPDPASSVLGAAGETPTSPIHTVKHGIGRHVAEWLCCGRNRRVGSHNREATADILG